MDLHIRQQDLHEIASCAGWVDEGSFHPAAGPEGLPLPYAGRMALHRRLHIHWLLHAHRWSALVSKPGPGLGARQAPTAGMKTTWPLSWQ